MPSRHVLACDDGRDAQALAEAACGVFTAPPGVLPASPQQT
jgi:hypothetical protein